MGRKPVQQPVPNNSGQNQGGYAPNHQGQHQQQGQYQQNLHIGQSFTNAFFGNLK